MLLTVASIAFVVGFAAVAVLGHVLVIQAIWRGRSHGREPSARPAQPLSELPRPFESDQKRAA